MYNSIIAILVIDIEDGISLFYSSRIVVILDD